MPMRMKDLCAHVASMTNPHSSAEALVMGIAEMVGSLTTRTEVANAAADLGNNAAALAAAIFWNTPLQGGMAAPRPVEPPWVPAPDPAQTAPPPAPGAHLAVEPEVEQATPQEPDEAPSEAQDEHGGEPEEPEADAAPDEPENGPVDRPARKPPVRHKPKGWGRR